MRSVILLALLLPASALAQALDFNVRDDAAWVRYSKLVDERSFGQVELDATAYIADNGRRSAGVGLHIVDNAYTAETPVYVGLGGRLLWVDGGPANGPVFALGGHGRYTLPAADRVSVGAHLYFAPDVLSFGDTDGYFEFAVRGEYHVLQSSWIYLGYRRARVGFTDIASRTIDSGLHLGIRIQF